MKPLFKPVSNSRTPKKLRKFVSWPKRETGSKSRACYKWAGLILIHLSYKPQEAIMCQSLRKRPQWLHWGHTQLHSSRGKAPCSAPVHAGPCGWGCELSNSPPHAIHSLPSCQRAAVQKSFESKQFPDKKNVTFLKCTTTIKLFSIETALSFI